MADIESDGGQTGPMAEPPEIYPLPMAESGGYPHYPPMPSSASLQGFLLRFPFASRLKGGRAEQMTLLWTAIDDLAAQTSENRHDINNERTLLHKLEWTLVGDGPNGPNTGRLGEMQASIERKIDARIEPVQNDVVFMRRFWKVFAAILTLAIAVAGVVAVIVVRH